MAATNQDRERFIRLVDAAEAAYPYVTAERLRSVASERRDWAPLTRRLAALIRQLLSEEALLCDNRERLRRDGRFQPVRLYRLNRRHLLVAEILDQAVPAWRPE